MNENLIQKISLQLYSLQKKVDEIKEKMTDDEVKKSIKEINNEIKKIDTNLLKETKIKFSDKQKEEALKWANILK